MAITVTHDIIATGTNRAASQISKDAWNVDHVVSDAGTTVIDKGTITTGTVTFVVSASSKQKLAVGGNLTVAFSGWAATDTYSELEIQLVNGGAFTITWPTIRWLKGDGTNSTTFADMSVTLNSSGTNWVIVWTTDGGTTLWGRAA